MKNLITILMISLLTSSLIADLGSLTEIASTYKKADTPSWSTASKTVIFTDLNANTLYELTPPSTIKDLRAGASRGKIVDGSFIGLIDGGIGQWKPGDEKPKMLLTEGVEGRPVSLNDLVISSKGIIYFTTLKDPNRGRVTRLDPATGKTTVLFDGEDHPKLSNPNGIVLNQAEDTLLVGISNYKQRKFSAIYAFPIKEDGTIDVAAGMEKPVIKVRAPDGICTDAKGNIYFTAGGSVHVYSADYKAIGKVKIPKGSGTNLCLGGDDGRTLYVTTREAIYSLKLPESF